MVTGHVTTLTTDRDNVLRVIGVHTTDAMTRLHSLSSEQRRCDEDGTRITAIYYNMPILHGATIQK